MAVTVAIASASLALLCAGLAVFFGLHARRTARQLGEVTRERDNLQGRLADMAATVGLLVDDDPDLDDLDRLSEAAVRIASGGRGLSPVEQAAIDRILRAGPNREAGAGPR